MSLSPWIKAARPRTLSLSMMPVIVGTALAWAAESQLRWPAVVAGARSAACSSSSAPICTMTRPIPNVAAMGRIALDLRGRPHPACWMEPPSIVAHAHVSPRRHSWALIWFGSAAGRFFCSASLSILSGWAYTGGPLPIAYTPLGELFVVAFFGAGCRVRHILALHGDDRVDRDRRPVLRWAFHRSGAVGQQSPRR